MTARDLARALGAIALSGLIGAGVGAVVAQLLAMANGSRARGAISLLDAELDDAAPVR